MLYVLLGWSASALGTTLAWEYDADDNVFPSALGQPLAGGVDNEPSHKSLVDLGGGDLVLQIDTQNFNVGSFYERSANTNPGTEWNVDPVAGYSLVWRVKLDGTVATESGAADISWADGVTNTRLRLQRGAGSSNWIAKIQDSGSININQAILNSFTLPGFDPNEFHTFQVNVENSLIDLFVDGVQVFDDLVDPISSGTNRFQFGDVTSSNDGRYQTQFFRTYQDGIAGVEQYWAIDGLGDWNASENWSFRFPPNGNDQEIKLGSVITAPTTIVTDQDVTVRSIIYDSSNGYGVSGQGSLILESISGDALLTVHGDAVAGDHQFQVPVSLHTDTKVNVGASASLSFHNTIQLNGNTLDIQSGTVNITATPDTGGTGSVTNSGSLGGGGTINGDLTNNSLGTILAEILATGTGDVDVIGLNVTGTADLSGTLDVQLSGLPLVGGQQFVVLTADNLIDSGLTLSASAASQFSLVMDTLNDVVLLQALLPGDFDDDGDVDGADFLLWQQNTSVGELADWENNYGVGPGPISAIRAVPEPSGCVLSLVALLAIGGVRCHFKAGSVFGAGDKASQSGLRLAAQLSR